MRILGLTGSIGMGKTTVAGMFASRGFPVWDADEQVHIGYEGGGEMEEVIFHHVEGLCPEATAMRRVDRQILGELVFNNVEKLKSLEHVFGRYLETKMSQFIIEHRWSDAPPAFVVLDVPLLFENYIFAQRCDAFAVVHCPPEEQKRRVMDRPGMTPERFAAILAKQMPVEQKMERADYLIDTSRTMLEVSNRVSEIVARMGG